jgi:lipooligosaccharide transport system permease protein
VTSQATGQDRNSPGVSDRVPSPGRRFFPSLSLRLWQVWYRNFLVFRRLFLVNFLLPMGEPLLYLVAMGFGLGTFIKQIQGISYVRFIGPGLVSVAMMYASFFECTYSSFVRMIFQRTFDAITATPVNVEEVVAGEIFWGATRAALNSTMVYVVVILFGIGPVWLLPFVAVFGFVCGVLFASMGMIATALVPSIDFFNYPIFLFITPMFLFSGTFFPLTTMPRVVQTVSYAILPLTHVVLINRAVILGHPHLSLLYSLAWILGVGTVAFFLAVALMKRRLIK